MGVNKLTNDNPLVKQCREPENGTCIILFEYLYENKDIVVRVLKTKVCPTPVNFIGKNILLGKWNNFKIFSTISPESVYLNNCLLKSLMYIFSFNWTKNAKEPILQNKVESIIFANMWN